MKSGGCLACHALGTQATREIPPHSGISIVYRSLGAQRIQSGQAGADMMRTLNQLGPKRALEMFADWTDRIAAGEVPPTPPRPQGIERNVVITEWDWADPKAYLHDEVSTDRRNPTLNANGLIYGSLELSADYLPVLDPVHNTISQVKLTVRDPNTPSRRADMPQPSPYWGNEAARGPAGTTCTIRCSTSMAASGSRRPCGRPTTRRSARRARHPSAKAFPLERSGRHLAVYDPKTQEAHPHQHLLRHASPDVCRGRESTRCGRAAADRWWAG